MTRPCTLTSLALLGFIFFSATFQVSASSLPQAKTNIPSDTLSNEDPSPLIPEQNSAQYIQKLQSLYLKNQADQALLMHINSLLTDYSLRPVQTITKTTVARYSLSHDHQGNLITSRQSYAPTTQQNQQSIINTTKINVYGIDPYITYRCTETSQSCWLRSPIQGSQWIEISPNEDTAKELAYALTVLIKLLQKETHRKMF
jgi:hypothetical protein